MRDEFSEAPPAYQPPAVASAPPAEDEIDILDILKALWRRKWWIAFATILAFIVSLIYLEISTPKYTAMTQLIVEAETQNVVDLEGVVSGVSAEAPSLNSQLEVLRSRNILGNTVDALSLDKDPEFVPKLRSSGSIMKSISQVVSSIKELIVPASDSPIAAGLVYPDREIAIDVLIAKLKLNVIPNTYVINISIETENPTKSSTLVNTIAEQYVSNDVASKVNETKNAAKWLGEQVDLLKIQLDDTEAEAVNYRRNTERVTTPEQIAASDRQLKIARGQLEILRERLGPEGPVTEQDFDRIKQIQNTIASLEEIATKQNRDLLKLQQLDREAKASREIYEYFLTRQNEVKVQSGTQDSNITVLSAALPRATPTSPSRPTAMIMGLFGGFLLGCALVMAAKIRDKSFIDPTELQTAFRVPVFGTIPKARTTNRRAIIKGIIANSSSEFMESIRSLRTSLKLIRRDGSCTVLLCTSSLPAEGKTTSAVSLAVSAAASQARVLLIECDLRRSTFHEYFGRGVDHGLISAINGENNPIHVDPESGVHVIFSEKSTMNAGDVFASQRFAEFISMIREHYDVVILDAPPVLPVPDARLLADHADKVLYCVHAGSTAKSTIAAGLRLFRINGVEITGLNLTQMTKGMQAEYGYYGSKYGGYTT